jgi:hypothetical protein
VNINRLRPTGVKRDNLVVWLSSVVHDAIRDAEEAGMPSTEIHQLLQTITDMHRPYGQRRSTTMANHTKPATLFDVRALDNKSRGTLLIADFGETKGKEPDFMATLAPPPFAAPPGFRTESAAVRALQEQVQAVYDQLASIADNLERNGR